MKYNSYIFRFKGGAPKLDSEPPAPNGTPKVTLRAKPAGTQAAEKMREFMHYVTNAFYGATGWNDDNTYKELNVTARGKTCPLPVL